MYQIDFRACKGNFANRVFFIFAVDIGMNMDVESEMLQG